MSRKLIDEFVDYYHNTAAPWTDTKWMGYQLSKCPMDLWVYQEIIHETQPELVIETGTGGGGSALFFASMMASSCSEKRMVKVVTIDEMVYPHRPVDYSITYLTGDSLGQEMSRHLVNFHQPLSRIMVVLDSLHTYEHVSKELELYAPLVSLGCYLVVEDTVVDGSWQKPAAHKAVLDYVAAHPEFQIDKTREKHLLTLNPDGWIRRVS